MIVMGAHRLDTVYDLSHGATMDRVLRFGDQSLFIVKSRAVGHYDNILVAVEFSEPSRQALEFAKEESQVYSHIQIATDGSDRSRKGIEHGVAVAKALGSRVTSVTVTGPLPGYTHLHIAAHVPEIMSQLAEAAEDHLRAAQEIAESEGAARGTILVKDRTADDGIIETAKAQGCELEVMGSHGWDALKRRMHGGVTQKLLTNSTIPVLVHR